MSTDNHKHDIRHKLWRNKTAMGCIILLCIMSIMAIFAYVIIPDGSTNANRQIPRIALLRPMSTQQFLLKPKGYDVQEVSTIARLVSGGRDRVDYIPVDTVSMEATQVITSLGGAIQYHDYQDILGDSDPEDVPLRRQAIMDSNLTSKFFLMGSDKYGRDVWSRLVLGLRASLIVGLMAVLVSLTIGIAIGSIGGYFGGWIDKMVMLIINTSWSIPTLLMAFAIIIALGKGFAVIILAVGLTMWVDVARIVRGQVMQTKNELYVTAANIMGYNHFKTITRHILPNITGPILVMAAANFATAILVEAGLSFLGVGIQPPTPSLGNMLQESYAYATGGFVYLAGFPILMIMSLVLTFNLLGTALRDVMDVRSLGK